MKTLDIPMEELAALLQTQLAAGGRAILVVTGSSMMPMLHNRRDRVVLEPPVDLRRTDVILFRRESGAYILHRIVRMGEEVMLCSGDNQWEPETVLRSQVVAKVTEFTRKGKTFRVGRGFWHLWARFWTGIFPVRRPLIALRRWVGRLGRKGGRG